MAEWLHRAVSGQSLTHGQLTAAGLFILMWFAMDVWQFVGVLTDDGCSIRVPLAAASRDIDPGFYRDMERPAK